MSLAPSIPVMTTDPMIPTKYLLVEYNPAAELA